MAEVHRMTVDEVVSYFLEGEGVDVLRESLRWVVQQLMEAEVSELIGAGHGERNPDRLAHRNGYRPRRWDTRVGELPVKRGNSLLGTVTISRGGIDWKRAHARQSKSLTWKEFADLMATL